VQHNLVDGSLVEVPKDAAGVAAEFLSHLNADRWLAAAAMVEPAQRTEFRAEALSLLLALATSRGPVLAIAPDKPPPLPPVTPERLAEHAGTLAPLYVQQPTFGYLAQLDPTAFLAYHWSDVIGHDRDRGRGICQERREVTGPGEAHGGMVAVPYAVTPPPAMGRGRSSAEVLYLRPVGEHWHVELNAELTSWRFLP
jgi:hypothetical protein